MILFCISYFLINSIATMIVSFYVPPQYLYNGIFKKILFIFLNNSVCSLLLISCYLLMQLSWECRICRIFSAPFKSLGLPGG